ncbi:MAG: hypothetical protein E7323_03880 [Clostridiales bacterium]|nr:hypothetical protein [Clostridiales bacterium]
MTGGAAGAMLCIAAGLAAGMAVRERLLARHMLLHQTQDMLARLRLMLQQERLGLLELLEECCAARGGVMPERFRAVAAMVRQKPLLALREAYQRAEQQIPCPGEKNCDKEALRQLFCELGTGTAAMREEAVAACLRRLKPAMEETEKHHRSGGKLCVQLGLLAGLVAGIMLW